MTEIEQIQTQSLAGSSGNAVNRIEIRRMIAVPFRMSWEFMISSDGIANWLGDIGKRKLEPHVAFMTSEGIEFNIGLLTHQSHIILAWRKRDWQINSVLQVSLVPSGNKTTIIFCQHNLEDTSHQEKMCEYWQAVLDKIEKLLTITYRQ
jgi:uncharacterized protein YndB with AHSA1/START domain